MILFRSACDNDLDAIHHLAEDSGVGITTLSKEKEILKRRLRWATDSFKKRSKNQIMNIIYLYWKMRTQK